MVSKGFKLFLVKLGGPWEKSVLRICGPKFDLPANQNGEDKTVVFHWSAKCE